MEYEKKLKELGIILPEPPRYGDKSPYLIDAVISGNLLFLSGCIPRKTGYEPPRGKVGKEITVEQASEAAGVAALNALSIMREVLGTLDRVKRIVRVIGYVGSAEGFNAPGKVVNGFSDVLVKVFGAENGRGARISLGVAALGGNNPIEVEVIAEIERAR